MINLIHGDCMEALKGMKDNQYDLAIVDPPYGIGDRLNKNSIKKDVGFAKMNLSNSQRWDIVPPKEYFIELFRISKNQIIWGGNFFNLPPCKLPICWDKVRPNQKKTSQWEYAWTSFTGRARLFAFCNNGGFVLPIPRIHPTQKPIKLYKWLLKNYAQCSQCKGDYSTLCPKCKGKKATILDTHGGSMSIALACHDMKYDLDLYEIDKDYYNAGKLRYENHIKQLQLF